MKNALRTACWFLLRSITVCVALVAVVVFMTGCGSTPRTADAGAVSATAAPTEPSASSAPAPESPSPPAAEVVRLSARPAPPAARTSAPVPARDQSGVTVRGRSELVTALNARRQAMGLKPVAYSAELSTAAEDCSRKSLAAGTLTHCGYEVLAMGGPNMTVDQLITMWFNSPPHKAALTHGTSTRAGGAIVSDGKSLVAAIRIDY
ncbi:CAP domain-containing protein [Longispora sp. K20-0274]|uniref:CAP domain-containing protein n=1 Tax=Longispora sp. K20-0274 TaxID=3088255 RepID=UPI00399AF2F8